MDLDEYKRMQQETESYRNNLENVSAERIALDRQYVKKLQESLALETEIVKKDIEIQKLKSEVESLNAEIANLKDKIVVNEIGELFPESCS